MNTLKNDWTDAADAGRGAESLDRRITLLALAVVVATLACTAIILFGSRDSRDPAFVQPSYGAQR